MAKKDFLEPTLKVESGMVPLRDAQDLVPKSAPLRRAYNLLTIFLIQCGIPRSACTYRYHTVTPQSRQDPETGRLLASINDGMILIEFDNFIEVQEVYEQIDRGFLGGSSTLSVSMAGSGAELVKDQGKFSAAKVSQMAHAQFAQVLERVLLDHGFVIGKNAAPRERNTVSAYTLLPLVTRCRVHFAEDRIELGTTTVSSGLF